MANKLATDEQPATKKRQREPADYTLQRLDTETNQWVEVACCCSDTASAMKKAEEDGAYRVIRVTKSFTVKTETKQVRKVI